MSRLTLLKGGAPFFYPGNRTGCVLVHGFTGMPNEVRWLGKDLHRRGYTVCGVRLAGHGTHPEDMIPIRWQEWYLDVLAGVQMLRERCGKVFALGLSMGGALSLMLAAREPVDGVVAMSTPHEVEDRRTRLLSLVHRIYPMIGKRRAPPEENPLNQRVIAEQRARGEEPIGHTAYPTYPTRAILELDRLLAEMRASLPRITAPILFIHSRMDDVVTFESLEKNPPMATGCRDKQVMTLEDSLHVITEDSEREKVFQAAADFIASHS